MDETEKLYAHWAKLDLDIESARDWMKAWANDWDQVLPWHDDPLFTSRSMAGHLSNFLEGGTFETGYAINEPESYIDTKYGSDLYFSGWTRDCFQLT